MNPPERESGTEQTSHPIHSIVLVGNPNSGKSALFNRLTGAHQKVANYAGVTVEKKEGDFVLPSGKSLHVTDLPGIYSLTPLTQDEAVTRQVLLGESGETPMDLIVFVADATNLRRSMKLILDVIALGHPTILALNMTDLARKSGQIIDLDRLRSELGIPVIETVAIEADGVAPLLDWLDQTAHDKSGTITAAPFATSGSRTTYTESRRILDSIIRKNADTYTLNRKIDAIVLHPFFGLPILLGILFLMFQAVFSWAELPMEWIENGVGAASDLCSARLPERHFAPPDRRWRHCRYRQHHCFPATNPDPVLFHTRSGRIRLSAPLRLFMLDKMMSSIGLSVKGMRSYRYSQASPVPFPGISRQDDASKTASTESSPS